MKRILAFAIQNFEKVKGYPDGINMKLMEDFFFEVKFNTPTYTLHIRDIKIDCYELKGPKTILTTKDEELIIEKMKRMLLDENSFKREMIRHLDDFEPIQFGMK
ncbi:hypothetical protein AAGF08_09680 [Algoriphagus sp. SE2]|uniref:hypothetical protein n=1 Tax=Algoriphagus sp. SE2 TaxID=3141536 RepID=UPI0031CD7DE0